MEQIEQSYVNTLNSLSDREKSLMEEVAEIQRKCELLARIDELEEDVSIISWIY